MKSNKFELSVIFGLFCFTQGGEGLEVTPQRGLLIRTFRFQRFFCSFRIFLTSGSPALTNKEQIRA